MDVLTFINNAGWKWQMGKTSLTIFPPDQKAADYLLDHFAQTLTTTATVLQGTVSIDWGDEITYRITHTTLTEYRKMSSIIRTPSAFVGILELTPQLLPAIAQILESPDKHMGLVRIRDNAQVLISASAARQIRSNGEEAVKRRTSDYWQEEDLQTLEQCYRDSPSSGFEITYTATLDKPKLDEDAQWGRFTTRFVLIEDGFGIVYRKGELLDLVEIPRPQVVY